MRVAAVVRRRPGPIGPAILLALAAHLLVVLLLGWKIPRLVVRTRKDDGPVVQVTLLRPMVPLRRLTSPERTAPASSSTPGASARVLTAPAPQAPLANVTPQATPQLAPSPVPPNLETSPDGDRVRSALRGLIGCTGALGKGLSHVEREECDRKLAAAKPAPTGPLYTAKEAKAFETPKDSIFVRKPHNECLPHIGAGRGQPGTSSAGATTFGLDCEWDFW
jgi:hypothetical protein